MNDPETGLPLPNAADGIDDFRQQILPGLEDSFPEPEPAVEVAAAEMPPEESGSAPVVSRGSFPRRLVLILLGVILASGAAAFGGVAAWRYLRSHTVVREVVRVVREPVQKSVSDASGVPVEMLPRDLAEAWAVVSDMSGTIGSDTLVFKRGRAQANGRVYAVKLDFARKGDFTYVKVAGNGLWVAQVDARGGIVRAYPCPRNAKPLKELFR